MSIDIGADLSLVDNPTAVTVTLVRVAATTAVSITNAIRGQLSKDLESTYNIQGNGHLWTIPNSELNPAANGREIRPQDELTDASHTHVVLSSKLGACDGKWTLVTNRKG